MNTAKLLGVGDLVALATAITKNQPRQIEEGPVRTIRPGLAGFRKHPELGRRNLRIVSLTNRKYKK